MEVLIRKSHTNFAQEYQLSDAILKSWFHTNGNRRRHNKFQGIIMQFTETWSNMARIKEYERPAGHIAQDLCSFVSPKISPARCKLAKSCLLRDNRMAPWFLGWCSWFCTSPTDSHQHGLRSYGRLWEFDSCMNIWISGIKQAVCAFNQS